MQGSAAFLFPAGRIEPESLRPPSTTNEAMSVRRCASQGPVASERGARKLPREGSGYNSRGKRIPDYVERFPLIPLLMHP